MMGTPMCTLMLIPESIPRQSVAFSCGLFPFVLLWQDSLAGADVEDEPEPPGLLPGGTLVVCPTSVLHQWAREVRDKVNPVVGFTLHTYHGKASWEGCLGDT